MRGLIMKYLILASLLTFSLLAAISTSTGAHPAHANQVVTGFGVATVQGRPAVVEVMVAVSPGTNPSEAAQAAVLELGARPVDSAEFTTSGLVWNQFFDADAGNNYVVQNYNPSKEANAGSLQALQNSEATWTNVASSSFTMQYGATTGRCPSLVRECPGPQVFDTNNDVGWLDLGRCTARCTLGVTWYSTSGTDEADMALNTRAKWNTNGQNYDIETVMLHENGHVVGLGHSSDSAAVMYAYYQGVRRTLGTDDINGVSALYP
jgi:hypothetical protein